MSEKTPVKTRSEMEAEMIANLQNQNVQHLTEVAMPGVATPVTKPTTENV